MSRLVVVTMHGSVMTVFAETLDTEVLVIDMDGRRSKEEDPLAVVEFPGLGRHAGFIDTAYTAFADQGQVSNLFQRAKERVGDKLPKVQPVPHG